MRKIARKREIEKSAPAGQMTLFTTWGGGE